MSAIRTLSALALAWASQSALAVETMRYSAAVIDNTTGAVSIVGRPDSFSIGPFASPGAVPVTVGAAGSSVQAYADSSVGVFKSLTRSTVAGGDGSQFTAAAADYFLRDTLLFNGPAGNTTAAFEIAWDTRISGLATQPADLGDGSRQPRQQAQSVQILEVSFEAPNPNFVQLPGCPPGVDFQIGNTEVMCPHPTGTQRYSMQNSIMGSTSYDGSIAGDGNGLYNGRRLVEWVVPFNVPITVAYTSWTYSSCDSAIDCDVTVDASHSNYLGIAAAPGQSYSSAGGYQYLGRPLAPVPEPATGLLALIGLVPLVARVRRRMR